VLQIHLSIIQKNQDEQEQHLYRRGLLALMQKNITNIFLLTMKFIMINSHGISGYSSASWLVYSPRRLKKQFMDYDLISNFFKESINYYIQACDNHNRIYPCIKQQILDMTDEECRGRLLMNLDNAMPDWSNA
jgi:hypothetical protein